MLIFLLQPKILMPLASENGLISTKTNKQTKEFLQSIHITKAFDGKADLRDIVDWPKEVAYIGTEKEFKGEIDGYINLIFTKKRIESPLRDYSNTQNACQIFVLYKEVDAIHDALFQLDKINYLLNKFGDDKVAARILNEEKLFKLSDLKSLVEGALFSKESKVKWIWNSSIDEQFEGSRNITSLTSLNRLLSDACEIAYPNTPKYLNEMVNREYLSSPILTARKALIRQMIASGDQIDLGFSNTLFPPEVPVFLPAFVNTENAVIYFSLSPFN